MGVAGLPAPGAALAARGRGDGRERSLRWAAKTFHPDRFPALDMAPEITAFYRAFTGHALTPAQAAEILSGTL
jgi:hypothetical protein